MCKTQVRVLRQQSSLNIQYHHTINSSLSPTAELAAWLKVSLPLGAGLLWPSHVPISDNLPSAAQGQDGERPVWKGLTGESLTCQGARRSHSLLAPQDLLILWSELQQHFFSQAAYLTPPPPPISLFSLTAPFLESPPLTCFSP